MINEIIAAISTALDAEFGDEYEIYMEEIKRKRLVLGWI